MRFPLIALALIGAGCADSLPEAEAPPPPPAYTSNITYAMPAPTRGHTDSGQGLVVPGARVEILDTPYLARPTEIVGFVEAHEEQGQHEAALDQLRQEAAAKGADAVVEVESHKGRREGEAARISGVAVRFVPSAQ